MIKMIDIYFEVMEKYFPKILEPNIIPLDNEKEEKEQAKIMKKLIKYHYKKLNRSNIRRN